MRGEKYKKGKFKGNKGRRFTHSCHIRATNQDDDGSGEEEDVQESGPVESANIKAMHTMMQRLTPDECINMLLMEEMDF